MKRDPSGKRAEIDVKELLQGREGKGSAERVSCGTSGCTMGVGMWVEN
jgi:hypothetical protein